MPAPLLEIDNLRVDYGGLTAVRNLSLSVDAGTIFGLIGPNGAGKTSTIRAVSTLVEPTYGQIRICGTNVELEPRKALAKLGYMPDFPPAYEDLSLQEFLALFASAYAIPKNQRHAKIGELLDQVSLLDKRDELVGSLSRGMRQRLFLAKTLLHDPEVLLLDEPASGLDPIARGQLIEVIQRLGNAGKAVVVSSHILTEMDRFCNAVGIMDNGEMKLAGRIEDIVTSMTEEQVIKIQLTTAREGLGTFLTQQEHTSKVRIEANHCSLTFAGSEEERAALLKALIQAEFSVSAFSAHNADLNEIFHAVAGGEEE
jgi:ABC-2 type transport system ATP-binding protein